MKKVIIIGAGASGLTCAINCKSENNEVVVLEKNSICGKKILITGNGRCNYYNDNQDIIHYHSLSEELLGYFINKKRLERVLDFFDSIGIIPEIKDGYYYPKSNQAVSIKNALELECINKGVKLIYNTEVSDIKKNNNQFMINTNNGVFEADVVVIATGSKASKKTGSDGIGYKLGKKFNHTVIEPLAGLVQLICDDKITNASGVRTKVKLTLIENNKTISSSEGELQITDYGISGIVSMQLSSLVARGLYENKNEVIKINFLPWVENIKTFLDNRNKKLKNRTISELLDGILNYKLVNTILKISEIRNEELYENLDSIRKDVLIKNLENYKVIIQSTKGFDNAQICSGGIALKEVTDNFESKLVSNLYFIGEVLDVNGDCGGYNLTFAWLSGIVVGEYIKNK